MNKLILPYNGKVKLSSPYGYRLLNGEYVFHGGVDFVGLNSDLIIAPCNGIVRSSTIITDKNNETWEWGNYVRIDCDNLQIFLCHMKERYVNVGDNVKVGDVIGREGNTGYSFGQHCHLEIRIDGTIVNPCNYLDIPNMEGIYVNQNPGNLTHEWSEKAVKFCIEKGILKGDSTVSPDYRLNENITREEMCVMLHRLSEYLKCLM